MLALRSAARLSPGFAASRLAVPRTQMLSAAPRSTQRAKSTQSVQQSFKSGVSVVKQYYPQILLVGGAGLVVYGLAKVSLSILGTVLDMDLTTAFNIGVGTGLSGALCLVGGALYSRRRISINPVQVMRKALGRVQESPVAGGLLGANVRLGDLQAWRSIPGHISTSKFKWVEPRAQLFFQVVGDKGTDAFVTAEAVKHEGGVVFKLLAIDMPAAGAVPASVHLLQGDAAKLEVKGALRGFLQVSRGAYLPQSRVEAEEDLIREQETLPDEEREEQAWRQAIADSKMPGRG